MDLAEFSTAQVHRFIVDECHFPVTPTKVDLAANAGELKAVKVAGKYKYSRRMALQWLESLGVQIDWKLAAEAAGRDVARRRRIEQDLARYEKDAKDADVEVTL
ncbi:hypothetical protein [Mycobacterium sp. 852002-10029_SCH5224772]|uniref:hypothetical protein n=1 Tax=Mycobacterium sp. 852002-10029_SCH5224772 TaxID=1834083 RepID=UPI0012E83618|nr:hypothetical protein [Mycobacterium sp. 852002-10029_SCH5224772]